MRLGTSKHNDATSTGVSIKIYTVSQSIILQQHPKNDASVSFFTKIHAAV